MAGSKEIKTTKEQIVAYWKKHVQEDEMSVDFSEAGERCWRCGCKRGLQRCHIVPRSLGGEDVPSNFVLLCSRCHLDNPNVADPEIMWDWLHAYKVPLYDTFWGIQGIKEYEKIYGITFREELKNRGLNDENSEELEEIIQKQFQRASYHFGDPHLNTATLAGIFRMVLKEYDRRHERVTEKNVQPYVKISEIL